jgi:hypothetical protein
VDVDNLETAGRYSVQNSIFSRNGEDVKESDDDVLSIVGTDTTFIALQDTVALPAWNNQIGMSADPLLADAFNRVTPDFRPGAGSPALAGFATPPSDGFFDVTVNYIGAVDPTAGTQWFEGWTTFVQN